MTFQAGSFAKTLLSAAALAVAATLSGCAFSNAGNGPGSSSTASSSATATGSVYGGQQPVSGAAIQLYAVGNSGLRSSSTALIQSTVLTDAQGGFNITGRWNCSDTATYGADPLLYLVATGGNPGSGDNPALALMMAIGRCSTLTPQSFLSVNEVSTVAAVYALAPFMADYRHIGAPVSLLTGFANAFATVATLVDPTTGYAPGPAVPTGAAVPVSEIYSLADSVAACVNSTGGAPCTLLFSASTPAGGSAPAETIGALLQIASAPSRNVSAIFNLAGAAAPFQPQLTSAPTDWTMAVKFTGGGLNGPSGLAVDASGNLWVANASGPSITALSAQGASVAGANGYSAGGKIFGAQAVAVDRTGSVWVADTLLSTIFKLTVSNGAVQSASSFSSGLNGPVSLAIDGGNRVWVANFGDGSVTELGNDGALMNGGPITLGGTLQAPAGIALDAESNVWITDNATAVVVKLDNHGVALSGAGFSDGALLAPLGIALDSAGRAWVADSGNDAASLFAPSGVSVISAPVMGGGLKLPAAVAIDGANVAWLANGAAAGSLTQIRPSADLAVGLGSLNAAAAVAVDASGNVWTANAGDNSVSKFVGLATPVVTPIAAGLTPKP